MSEVVNTLKSEKSAAICIMVEPGNLEWQFIILVSSLLGHCYDDYKIYAYCREDRLYKLRAETLRFASKHKISIEPIKNPYHDGYPQGNKIIACSKQRQEKWTIFLDTDTALMRPARILDAGRENHLSFVPARKKTWTTHIEDWRKLFDAFEMRFPRERVQLGFGGSWIPYSNAGVIIFDHNRFSKTWLDISLEIDKLKGFPSFRPWLDQVALTVAAYNQNISLNILEMKWNDTPMFYSKSTIIMHYHNLNWMKKFGINIVLNELVAEYSDFSNIGELWNTLRHD